MGEVCVVTIDGRRYVRLRSVDGWSLAESGPLRLPNYHGMQRRE